MMMTIDDDNDDDDDEGDEYDDNLHCHDNYHRSILCITKDA